METMNMIEALSTNVSSSITSQINVKMLKQAQNVQELEGKAVIELLENANLGNNIDIKA